MTAWAAFQATKWSGVQANSYSMAGASRVESTRASTEAGQLIARPGTESAFLFERLRGEFQPAVEAWLETQPLTDPAAPKTPFEMLEYQLSASQRRPSSSRRPRTLPRRRVRPIRTVTTTS